MVKLRNTAYRLCAVIIIFALLTGFAGSGSAAEAQSFSYTADSTGEGIILTGFNDSSVTELVIPDSIDGKPVREIAERAFRGVAELRSVQFSDTLQKIGECAFMGCTSLESVSIPENVREIGESAFCDCPNLKYAKFVSDCSVCYDSFGYNYVYDEDGWVEDETITPGFTIEAPIYSDAYYAAENNGFSYVRYIIPVKFVTLSKTDLTMTPGTYEYIYADILPDDADDRDIRWYTSNSKVATVSYGDIYAVGKGTAVITAEASNGVKATCTVTVRVPVSGITLNKSEMTLAKGKKFTLKAKIYPDNANDKTVNWKSSDSDIASVKGGVVTGKKTGTAKIYAIGEGKIKSCCKVRVVIPAKKISLDKKSVTLKYGKTYTLKAKIAPKNTTDKKVTWLTSNPRVVTVSKGKLKPRGAGTATVTAKTTNGKKITCKVKVIVKPTFISANCNVVTLKVGRTAQIGGRTDNGVGYDKLYYSSENKKIASVSKKGVITAKDCGSTNVIVKTKNGKKDRIVVLVRDTATYSYPYLDETNSLLNSVKPTPTKTHNKSLDTLLDDLFAKIHKKGMTNAEKVQACYDYIVKKWKYTFTPYYSIENTPYKMYNDRVFAQTAYDSIKSKKGSCYEYSISFLVMMRRLGYKADLVSGKVAMQAGGYGGHYWVDVTIKGRHYIFDPQVESNNLRNKQIYHFYYGMKPENNTGTYKYADMIYCNNFKI